MKEQILKDKILDELLLSKGFVIIPFLKPVEIQDLLNFYHQNHTDDIPGFYASVFSLDINLREEITKKIKSIYVKIIENTFINYKLIGGIFIVKTNNEKERLHPHQDWAFIDEEICRGFNIWIPLVDINEDNGAIRITPESHLWANNFRGPKIQDSFPNKQEEIWQNMTTLNLKAGEALIYDARLFHASYPNQTDKPRIATVFGAIPKDATMYHYIGDGEFVDVFESNEAFFLGSNINNGASVLNKVKRVKNFAIKNKNLPEYMNDKNIDAKIKTSWFRRIFNK
jgi:hypothetical protein